MIKKVKFLVIGGINTIFSYLFSLLVVYSLIDIFSFTALFIFINIVCIAFSFSTYNCFLYKLNIKDIPQSFFKFVLSNIYLSLFSFFFLYWMYEILLIEFLFAQTILTTIIIIKSYILHKNFSFKVKKIVKKK